MKKIYLPLLILLCSFAGFSAETNNDNPHAGTYGVTKANPTQIELVLLDDYKFRYTDLSNPKKPIEVSGTYAVKGNKVQLKDFESDYNFHKKLT